MVLINYNQKQALREINEYTNCDEFIKAIKENPDTRGLFVRTEDKKYLLWVQPNKELIMHQTIAHEVFHIASNILMDAGVRFSEDSEEAYAYLIGYLTEQVYKGLLK